MSAKRGQPARPRLNARLTAEEAAAELSAYPPGDPFRDLLDDGQGLDFRLPAPPWDDAAMQEANDNLARLRVDPTMSNYASLEAPLVRAIAGFEVEPRDLGIYFAELLADHNAETVERIFKDIARMRKNADEPPHRNFLAYRAYCDFLLEFGFEPSIPKLVDFIRTKPADYPVGISSPAGGKEWWQMFFEAGIARLAE